LNKILYHILILTVFNARSGIAMTRLRLNRRSYCGVWNPNERPEPIYDNLHRRKKGFDRVLPKGRYRSFLSIQFYIIIILFFIFYRMPFVGHRKAIELVLSIVTRLYCIVFVWVSTVGPELLVPRLDIWSPIFDRRRSSNPEGRTFVAKI